MAMTNAEWCIKQGYKFNDINVLYTKENGVYAISIKKNGAYTCLGTIKKTCAIYAFMEWLDMEHVEQVLDEAEKRYLSAVIRPFRNQIISIYKEQFGFNHESIIIVYYDFDRSQSTLCLPQFEKGSMYAGMKTGWRYTLEELGL